MRTLALLAALVALAAPAAASAEMSGSVRLELSHGWLTDGAPTSDDQPWTAVARPFGQTAIDLVGEVSGTADQTVLGTPVGLWGKLLVGGVAGNDDPLVGNGFTLPMRMLVAGGSLFPVWARGDWDVQLHASTDVWVFGPQPKQSFLLAFYGGVRVDAALGPGGLTLRLQYDVKPFWLGIDRMDHVFSARVMAGAWGLRLTALVGQEKKPEGGYPERTLSLALEWGW